MVLARSLSGTITISIEALADLPLKFGIRMNHGSSQKTSFSHLRIDQRLERLFPSRDFSFSRLKLCRYLSIRLETAPPIEQYTNRVRRGC
jgi:hypothetical protein